MTSSKASGKTNIRNDNINQTYKIKDENNNNKYSNNNKKNNNINDDDSDDTSENDDINDLNNTIRLNLKKPKSWNWELTTSKSSPNIAFPKIKLYNEKGILLAKTNKADTILKSSKNNNYEQQGTFAGNTNLLINENIKADILNNNYIRKDNNNNDNVERSNSFQENYIKQRKIKRSISTNLVDRNETTNFLSGIVNQLEKNGIDYKIRRCNSNENKRSFNEKFITKNIENETKDKLMLTNKYINSKKQNKSRERTLSVVDEKSIEGQNTELFNDINNYEHSKKVKNIVGKLYKRSISSNLEEFNRNSSERKQYASFINENVKNVKCKGTFNTKTTIENEQKRNFIIKKSKSALEIPNNNLSQSQTLHTPNDKRKYRRAQSINSMRFSTSILERISEFKRRSSSSSSDNREEFISIKKKIKNCTSSENDESLDVKKPKYTLKTSNAGTLVVCEESFRNRRVRRRSRSCSKLSDNDVNTYEYKEKVKKEYEYFGKDIDNPRDGQTENSVKNSVKRRNSDIDNRYETAIANIDNLIKKLNIKKEHDSFEKKTRKTIQEKSCNCLLPERINQRNSCDVKNMNLSKSNDNINNKSTFWDTNYLRFKQDEKKTELDYLKQNKTKNKSVYCVDVDVDVNGKKSEKVIQKRVRRSASAGTNLSISSSSSNEGVNERTTVYGRARRQHGRVFMKKDDKNNGDQTTVAIKSVATVPTSANIVDSTSRLLCNNSDEVLLRLVQRLASLQQQQHQHQNSQRTLTDTNSLKYTIQNNSYKSSEYDNKNDKSSLKSIEKNERTFSENFKICDPKENLNKKINPNINDLVIKNKVILSKFIEDKETLLQKIDIKDNMGSTVSRSTGKGLSGRRTQSSGNLCNGKNSQQTPTASTNNNTATTTSNTFVVGGRGTSARYYIKGGKNDNSITDNSLIKINTTETCKLMNVCKKDRNKFCGSLPNHLDSDDVCDNEFQHQPTLYKDKVEYVTVGSRRNQSNNDHQQQLLHQQQQQFLQQQHSHNSPYNNSSSGKGSITSSSNLGSSTFKTNHENRLELQLKIPINRANLDTGCDQGYGSERSPEDEIPPPLPLLLDSHYDGFLTNMPFTNFNWNLHENEYNFITKDCTFPVQIIKGPRGLGLSVSGGSDSNAAFPGLIRIKRLFPHQAAWSTGMLQPGDILLEANGIPLTGLTNYEALEVLRTTPNNVLLIVCRPRDERYRKLSPPTEPPKPPQRTSMQNLPLIPLDPLTPIQTNYSGEFEIIMTKQQGSLGFTLRKEDESVLGHYVRALVRDPALNDGRIKPGDKIVAVNDVPLSPMTHEEAVIFLRQAADTVKLRFYRDEAQTPVAALSPTNPENKSFCNTLRTKAHLRPEAINLLSDLAYRKQTPCDSTGSSLRSSTTSPRRLRRVKGNNISGNTSQSDVELTESRGTNQKYLISTQTSCSDSDTSTFSQCSFLVQPATPSEIYTSDEACKSEPQTIEYYEEDELFQMVDELEDRPDRPRYLDLVGESGSTPGVSRKPRFQFTVAANSYELNNLDNDALDAPIYTKKINNTQELVYDDFNSLPCETFLVACMTESDLNNAAQQKQHNFNHKNPMYQSAVIQTHKDTPSENIKKDGTKSLLKWKGVTFSPDEEKETPGDSSCDATVGTNPTPGTDRDLDFNGFTTDTDGHKLIIVELNRGWNSRLGFSLQSNPNTRHPIISAIYNDSVAAKDGRLKVGDQLVMVNDEPVEHMTTSEIIDLLRIIRGSICISVIRDEDKQQ